MSSDPVCVSPTFSELVMGAYMSELGDGGCITQGFYHLLIGASLLLRRPNDCKSVRTQRQFYLQTRQKNGSEDARSTCEVPSRWTSRWTWRVRGPAWQRWWACPGPGLMAASSDTLGRGAELPWPPSCWRTFRPTRKSVCEKMQRIIRIFFKKKLKQILLLVPNSLKSFFAVFSFDLSPPPTCPAASRPPRPGRSGQSRSPRWPWSDRSDWSIQRGEEGERAPPSEIWNKVKRSMQTSDSWQVVCVAQILVWIAFF